MIPGTRVQGEDSGHGKAWRCGRPNCESKRPVEMKTKFQVQQGSQRAILEGICPNGAEQSRSPGGQGGEEMKNSDPQEMLGNTWEVNRVEAKRKESPSVLHHATHWAKSQFPRVTK